MSLDTTLSEMAAQSEHDLIVMTAATVVNMQKELLPGIIRRLDHTNGGFHDHEKRLKECEECLARERDEKNEARQDAITENNTVQTKFLKKWGVIFGASITVGALFGGVIAGLIGQFVI